MLADITSILTVLAAAVLFFGLAMGLLVVGLVLKKGGKHQCICGRADLDQASTCDGSHKKEQQLVQINVEGTEQD